MSFKFLISVLVIIGIYMSHCASHPTKPNVYGIKEDGTNRNLLNVQIDLRTTTPYITVTCFDYESLDNLNLAYFEELEIGTTPLPIHITFIDCYNDETHHKNYQHFGLHNAITDVPNYLNSEHFEIHFDDYGVVDGGKFFGELNLAQYKNVSINSVGFVNSSFLGHVQSERILLLHTDNVNFDDFSMNTIIEFRSVANTIVNFTKMNLAKFPAVKILKICDFIVHDYEILNVPNLFAYNTQLERLSFKDLVGDVVIELDESVFNGLHRLACLVLKGINLETIPIDLFRDLPVLEDVNLENNNLKTLGHDAFVNNPALSRIQLGRNKLFLSQNLYLELRNDKVTVDILNTQFNGFHSISSLIANPNIEFMNLHESNLKKLKLSDFDQIHDRSPPIHIVMNDAEAKFSIGQLRAKQIKYQFFSNLTEHENQELNAIVYISSYDSNFCGECDFIRDIFPYYLNGLPEDVEVYLRDSKVLIKLLTQCRDLERFYTYPFTYNCPPECACKFNPLLDKVYINCSGRGLETIPQIPYPIQFYSIDSMNLDMSKNYLSTINFDNQPDKVLQVLSTFDFTNNHITSIQLTRKAPLVIHVINLCENDFLDDDNIVISLNVNERWTNVTKAVCHLGTAYPKNIDKYISNKSREHIHDILSTVRCNL